MINYQNSLTNCYKLKARFIAQPIIDDLTKNVGSVFSVFERSCNLLINEKLIGIIPTVFGNNPASIVIEDDKNWTSCLKQGMPVLIDKGEIRISDKLIINLKCAKIWDPKLEINFANFEQGFVDLDKLIHDKYPFSSLFLQTVFNYFHQQDHIKSHNICDKIIMFLHQLTKQNLNSDFEIYANNLVGLGSGLTPSGDDFLAGLIAFFNIFSHRSKDISSDLNKKITLLNNIANSAKTTLLSQMMLQNATNGYLAQIVGDFLVCLFDNETNPTKEIEQKLEAVLSIGHCSGEDLLAGVYTAIFTLKTQIN